jgi:hypothetical protein
MSFGNLSFGIETQYTLQHERQEDRGFESRQAETELSLRNLFQGKYAATRKGQAYICTGLPDG